MMLLKKAKWVDSEDKNMEHLLRALSTELKHLRMLWKTVANRNLDDLVSFIRDGASEYVQENRSQPVAMKTIR